MLRNLVDEKYTSRGGMVPVKWMSPEVCLNLRPSFQYMVILLFCRPSVTTGTPLPVMCGALVVSCMRYGVSDMDHLQIFPMLRCAEIKLKA